MILDASYHTGFEQMVFGCFLHTVEYETGTMADTRGKFRVSAYRRFCAYNHHSPLTCKRQISALAV